MQSLFSLFSKLVLTLTFATFEMSSSDSYISERNRLLELESAKFLGGELNLTPKETLVDGAILKAKKKELAKGYENIAEYLPANHFFKAKDRIEQSEIFSIIRKLPKGGSLHTHYLAGVSIDYIIKNITYRANIYGGYVNGVFKLKFFGANVTSDWKSLKEYRQNDPNFDSWLRNQLSLEVPNPQETYTSAEVIWTKFKRTFTTQYDMVSHRPVFEEYVYELLHELYSDNVMYTELRGTILPLYELDGTARSARDFFGIFARVVEKFKEDHPKFVGARYIHSVYRGATPDDLRNNLKELLELKSDFPDFIIGFDFVGHEEEGRTLFDHKEVLLEFGDRLKFYFHAGETNWYGHTDLNLADAILLNTARIGHGFGLGKHPVLAESARNKNICVEVCPISNQVLKLLDDLRNHPAIGLMAEGFPVVICNDDPAVWGAAGLSYDWYMAFMAMTPESAGIKVLKQFALNSISYSALGEEVKKEAMAKWERQWDEFLDEMITLYRNID